MINPTPIRKYGDTQSPHFGESQTDWSGALSPSRVEQTTDEGPAEDLALETHGLTEPPEDSAQALQADASPDQADLQADLQAEPSPNPSPDLQADPAIAIAGQAAALGQRPEKRRRSGWVQWFRNLPLGRKQLLAMMVGEIVPLLGLGVGSTLIITHALRQQLVQQAKSEVEITDVRYRIKMDQMGFGSRGQSDNAAIVKAVVEQSQGLAPTPGEMELLRRTLNNEIQARSIEYATLVGGRSEYYCQWQPRSHRRGI